MISLNHTDPVKLVEFKPKVQKSIIFNQNQKSLGVSHKKLKEFDHIIEFQSRNSEKIFKQPDALKEKS